MTSTATPAAEPAGQLETVTERLQRLERELTALRDPSSIEKAVAARVIASLHERVDGAPHGMATGETAGIAGLVPAALMTAATGKLPDSSVWTRIGGINEFRLMYKMYFDPRYRLSRVAQFAVPVLLALIVGNYFAFAFWTVPVLAPVLERIFLIVFAIILYKVLSREAARYGEVLKYLAAFGR